MQCLSFAVVCVTEGQESLSCLRSEGCITTLPMHYYFLLYLKDNCMKCKITSLDSLVCPLAWQRQ